MFNSFGNIFRLTSFGESHGPGVGGVIDGFPAGIKIDMDFVQQELNRRRPGEVLLWPLFLLNRPLPQHEKKPTR